MQRLIPLLIALLIGLLCGIVVAGEPAAAGSSYSFAVVGDTQLGSYEGPIGPSPIWLSEAEQIRDADPAFVIHLGDAIGGSRYWDLWCAQQNAFLDTLDGLPPMHFVLGNHDISKRASQIPWWESVYGPRYYSWKYRGDLFIVLSSEEPDAVCTVSGVQLQWLQHQLRRRSPSKHCFIFMHEPMWLSVYLSGNRAESNWWQDVHPLLARSGVDAVFSAHIHAYEDWGTTDGVRYLVSGGGGGDLAVSVPRVARARAAGAIAESEYHWLLVDVRNRGRWSFLRTRPDDA